MGGSKNLLNQNRVSQVAKSLWYRSIKCVSSDRGYLYDGLSLVITTAAIAPFKHWVSAWEFPAGAWICRCPDPNCCNANCQLPSPSLGGERMILTTAQLEALQALIHLAVDQAARTLEHLINLDVYGETSDIQVLIPLDVSHELIQQFSAVQLSVVSVNFSGFLNGTVQFILPLANTARLLSIVNRQPIAVSDLNRVRIGTFLEMASVLLNHILGTVIDQIHQPLHISMPTYRQTKAEDLLLMADLVGESTVLLARTQLEVEPLQFVGDLLLVFRANSFNTFLSKTIM